MPKPDLNLLWTLDVLLAEGSVAGAARRLRLSPSAMSRSLARLRAVTGDPLLVRAGRGLVASPRAVAMREQVRRLVHEAQAALRPSSAPDLLQLDCTFTLRTREGFVENYGARLWRRAAKEAPHVRLIFMPKADRDSTLLRDGTVDLETGIVGRATGPEVRTQALFRERFIGVVRAGHPLAKRRITAARYAAAHHIGISPRLIEKGHIDAALARLGMEREVAVIAGGLSAAVALARGSDLLASVPERHTLNLRSGMHSFPIPLALPEMTVSLLWHPRLDGDPAHRWLRECVRAVCAE